MLAELSITLLGRGTQLSGDLGRILKIIDESGIRYKLTPSGTCLEGEWDEVMDLVKKCHRLIVLLLGAAILLSNRFAAAGRADNPRREIQAVEFTDTIRLHGALRRGQYLIVHDEERMARGEPCTYVYRGKTERPEKLVVAFHCEHMERARAKEFKFVIYNQNTPYSTPEVRKFQFANSTAGHRVP